MLRGFFSLIMKLRLLLWMARLVAPQMASGPGLKHRFQSGLLALAAMIAGGILVALMTGLAFVGAGYTLYAEGLLSPWQAAAATAGLFFISILSLFFYGRSRINAACKAPGKSNIRQNSSYEDNLHVLIDGFIQGLVIGNPQHATHSADTEESATVRANAPSAAPASHDAAIRKAA